LLFQRKIFDKISCLCYHFRVKFVIFNHFFCVWGKRLYNKCWGMRKISQHFFVKEHKKRNIKRKNPL
jgi:hypothetical protein